MAVSKNLLVWSLTDLSVAPGGAGSMFTVGGTPDLMSFTDGSTSVDEVPSDFNPVDSDQILSGSLDGAAVDAVLQFESAYLVTDGAETFWVYHLTDTSNNAVGYVSEQPLIQGTDYTVVRVDGSPNFDNTNMANSLEANPYYDDFADGVVEGTGDDDVITSASGYTDLDGEQVDGADGQGTGGNDDTITGGAGSDTIDAGAGDDVVFGDHAPDTDLAAGQTDFVVSGYFKGENLHLTNDHFNSDGATQFVVDTAPTSIRFVDDDSFLDADGPPGATNEMINPDDSGLVEIDGQLYRYVADYLQTFDGSDGNEYTFILVDVDLNGDGTTSVHTDDDGIMSLPGSDEHFEDGQILLPVGTPPPPGVTLTSQGAGVSTTLITSDNIDYTTLDGYEAGGSTYDDSIAGGSGNDTLIGGLGDDSVDGGTGADLIAGDDISPFFATDPDALIWTPPSGAPFSYSSGSNLGNGVAGGSNHLADVAGSEVSDLQIFLPTGDLNITSGDTIGFSFVDENGQTIIVQNATVQQSAYSTGADDTGAVSAQGADQFGNQIAVLLKLTNNDGSPSTPIAAGSAFVDNDTDPLTATDVTLSVAQSTSAYSGDGNDTLRGGDGVDTLLGGDGDDLLEGGAGGDVIEGGAGTDWASYESSDAAVTVSLDENQASNQTGGIAAAGGHATGDTLDGIENLQGSAYNDALEGDGGINIITGGDGNDSIYGAGGTDLLYGEDGNDLVDGGTSNDIVDGGAGHDTLVGGDGDDELTGGDGNDTFVYTNGDGHDTITDFGAGETGPTDDGYQDNNDFVDLSGNYNWDNYNQAVSLGLIDGDVIKTPLQWMRADQADDGVLNDSSVFGTSNSLTLNNGGAAVAAEDLTYDNTNVICFVRGSRIATARGVVPVEYLKPGDRVITRDNGYQEIRWIGSTTRPAMGKTAPILIREGVMGNIRDLLVSPNHRMLLRGPGLELVSGENEVLAPAKFLVNMEGVLRIDGGKVEYFHILFDRHEIINAEGCWSESFHPGHVGWSTLCEETRGEILELFPDLKSGGLFNGGCTARQVLDRKQMVAAGAFA